MESNELTPQEIWKPVVGWEGLYEVSSLGRVKSTYREVVYRDGRRRVYPERILKTTTSRGYQRLEMKSQGRSQQSLVHRLVAEAFLPNPENHPQVLHWNDEGCDNRLENLRWGTPLDNMRDLVRNQGGHYNSIKTHCKRGHEFTPETTSYTSKGHRRCLTCRRTYESRKAQEKIGTEPPQHGTTNGYHAYKCRCEPCKAAASEKSKEYRTRVREHLNQKKREWYHRTKKTKP